VADFNLFTGSLADEPRRAGFGTRRIRLADEIGAERLGASLYELEPGERTWPYHYESANEEWLLVVTGTPTLRSPDGERVLRAGDVVCFPTGPAGAHDVRNDGDGPARVLILSTRVYPEVPVYPDSDKIGARATEAGDRDRLYFVRTDAVDYWEGE
jgi:uncharacterized cupin superfamily protein